MKKKRLVTSALPYVNNTPHLGNLIQILSADVYARYCRYAGYETFFACGTDEYGTASETRALKEGITPQELCDRYFALHRDIYAWFNVQFDHFGRTSCKGHTQITQDIFKTLDAHGLIQSHEEQQLYCDKCERFLADRFVYGVCPHCGYTGARGDQCEKCSTLLNPTELVDPHCEVCGQTPCLQATTHLYLDLPKMVPKLEAWVNKAEQENRWANNALAITRSWIRDGLKERCITRDLKWGIPVPKPGFENKVFYVWFDAPIGYISITAEKCAHWKDWWQNPDEVELVQFVGKDNIPFHTVMFPCTLLGTEQPWTLLHTISSSEYLNYENGKFSKSRGTGIFGNDCCTLPFPADMWRFYLFYNRPERHDTQFVWKDFQERINSELIGNYSNFINRTLTFCHKFYNGQVPNTQENDLVLQEKIINLEQKILQAYEKAQLKDALMLILQLSDLGNKTFQQAEPWRLRTEDPAATERLIGQLAHLAHDLGQLIAPFLPQTAEKICEFFQRTIQWDNLGKAHHLGALNPPHILFQVLEDKLIDDLRIRFSGTQNKGGKIMNDTQNTAQEQTFEQAVDLRVAYITQVERHPDAEKLYILQLRLGTEERQIVSSIVPYYQIEELQGKKIIIVANLKKAKFRGVPSEGMLLAAGRAEQDECEVLFVDAPDGMRVLPEGAEDIPIEKTINIDKYSKFPLSITDGVLYHNGRRMLVNGQPVLAHKYTNSVVE